MLSCCYANSFKGCAVHAKFCTNLPPSLDLPRQIFMVHLNFKFCRSMTAVQQINGTSFSWSSFWCTRNQLIEWAKQHHPDAVDADDPCNHKHDKSSAFRTLARMEPCQLWLNLTPVTHTKQSLQRQDCTIRYFYSLLFTFLCGIYSAVLCKLQHPPSWYLFACRFDGKDADLRSVEQGPWGISLPSRCYLDLTIDLSFA